MTKFIIKAVIAMIVGGVLGSILVFAGVAGAETLSLIFETVICAAIVVYIVKLIVSS